MKKFNIVFLAVALAVLSIASINKKFGQGLGCGENLYWVPVSGNFTCADISSTSFLGSIIDVDFNEILTPIDFDPVPASNHPLGCGDAQTIACALGYRANQFEKYQDGGVIKFRVKANQLSNWRCCITIS
jgi:hypothetical protein